MSKPIYLSASRIKQYAGCSWKYYARYHLDVPEDSNDGARRGSVVHDFLECLLRRGKDNEFYNFIISNGTPQHHPVLERFIRLLRHKHEVSHDFDNKGVDNLALIYEMIHCAVKYDFFLEEWEVQEPEEQFEYESAEPYYRIKGFIDKYGRKDLKAKILDYKTSSSIDPHDHEIQAMMYSLWALRVKQLDAFIEFLFLRYDYPENVVSFNFDTEELEGFEIWLEDLQRTFENFTVADATADFAADKPYTDGFAGPVMCGRSMYDGQLKKDGTPMYSCSYKWGRDYYGLKKDGEVVTIFMNEESIVNPDNLEVVQLHYYGCPRWNHGEG